MNELLVLHPFCLINIRYGMSTRRFIYVMPSELRRDFGSLVGLADEGLDLFLEGPHQAHRDRNPPDISP